MANKQWKQINKCKMVHNLQWGKKTNIAIAPHLTDILGYRLDMNSISCLRQFCKGTMRKELLYMLFVFVLIRKRNIISKVTCICLYRRNLET